MKVVPSIGQNISVATFFTLRLMCVYIKMSKRAQIVFPYQYLTNRYLPESLGLGQKIPMA